MERPRNTERQIKFFGCLHLLRINCKHSRSIISEVIGHSQDHTIIFRFAVWVRNEVRLVWKIPRLAPNFLNYVFTAVELFDCEPIVLSEFLIFKLMDQVCDAVFFDTIELVVISRELYSPKIWFDQVFRNDCSSFEVQLESFPKTAPLMIKEIRLFPEIFQIKNLINILWRVLVDGGINYKNVVLPKIWVTCMNHLEENASVKSLNIPRPISFYCMDLSRLIFREFHWRNHIVPHNFIIKIEVHRMLE